MNTSPPLAETIESILQEREPNFLRLYLNPHVAEVCLCLDRYARTTWPGGDDEDFQSFLANGVEEAIASAPSSSFDAIACPPMPGRLGLILDPADLRSPASSRPNWLAAGTSRSCLTSSARRRPG